MSGPEFQFACSVTNYSFSLKIVMIVGSILGQKCYVHTNFITKVIWKLNLTTEKKKVEESLSAEF